MLDLASLQWVAMQCETQLDWICKIPRGWWGGAAGPGKGGRAAGPRVQGRVSLLCSVSVPVVPVGTDVREPDVSPQGEASCPSHTPWQPARAGLDQDRRKGVKGLSRGKRGSGHITGPGQMGSQARLPWLP